MTRRRVGRTHGKARQRLGARREFLRSGRRAGRATPAGAGIDVEVLERGQPAREALLAAAARHEADAGAIAAAGVAEPSTWRPSKLIRPDWAGRAPNSARPTRMVAGAAQPDEAEGLAPTHREARPGPRCRRRPPAARRAGRRREDVSADDAAVAKSVAASAPPTIHSTSSALRRLGDRPVRDTAAVAQHRHAVGDPEHLVEPVGDVEQPDAARLQAQQLVEQQVDVGGRQRRGRLVEHQEVALRASARAMATIDLSAAERARPARSGSMALPMIASAACAAAAAALPVE